MVRMRMINSKQGQIFFQCQFFCSEIVKRVDDESSSLIFIGFIFYFNGPGDDPVAIFFGSQVKIRMLQMDRLIPGVIG